MILDGLTVMIAATFATLYEQRTTPLNGARGFWHGTLIHGQSRGVLLGVLLIFMVTLIETSRRMHLYTPSRLSGFLNEQRLTFQACLISGLLLTGTLYILHAAEMPRSIVLITLGLVMVSLSLRRLVYRSRMCRRFQRGVDTRNVLIVGTGPEARALRHHLTAQRHFGYVFKGFVELGKVPRFGAQQPDVVATLDSLFDCARKEFVDEIFIAGPCDAAIVPEICTKARAQRIDLRVVPDMYGGLAWNRQVEYVGPFPTIPLHFGEVPELALVLKRILDVIISLAVMIAAFPLLALIAILIKLESPGPVLYISERIGKKGKVFGCIKFRTMVRDAEKLRSNLLSMNERDGVLFKVKHDPRITRLGRFLRKYSLDEIPQFVNVILGDMSIVGPRPPIASEVREYELKHLRRLDVLPGITGLWQVQARQDPSFESYIMLDLAYIENWTVWLDLKIIVRTVGVLFAGTGS
jgi:exopolysaccharide biosynthesis polyprenyl glycosylphosphotransferase